MLSPGEEVCVSASLGETGGHVRVPCPVIAAGKEKQGKKRGMKGWEGLYRGGRTRRRPSALQRVLTRTQVCVPAPEAPWGSHGGGLRQPLELYLSFQPHAGSAPHQGFLLHSEGWVTWQVFQPPEAPRQTTCFVRTSAVWVDFPWW